MPDIVPMVLPLKFDEDSKPCVDLDEWRRHIRNMPLDDLSKVLADGTPALKAMIKVFEEEAVARMQELKLTQLAVMSNGAPDGRLVKIKKRRKHEVDLDRLEAAQVVFRANGRGDVTLVIDTKKAVGIKATQKVANSVGKDDSKELQEAAGEAILSFDETWSRSYLAVEKNKAQTGSERIAAVRQELEEMDTPNPFDMSKEEDHPWKD